MDAKKGKYHQLRSAELNYNPRAGYTRAAPEVIPPLLSCCPTVSEADSDGMAVEVERSY